MIREGIDYSSGGIPSGASMHAYGKTFKGRYAVNDISPRGRGYSADEYKQDLADGTDVFLYWEGQARWMIGGIDPETGQDCGPGGWTAGVLAAQNANSNLLACDMPPTMPFAFAHDIDPQPEHFPIIDQCLSGCASVIGWPRVGAYAGWLLIDYLAGGGTVKQLVQTVAWEYGRGLHPAATLYQYDTYGNFIDGVDVDLVRAVKDNFGQASLYHSHPLPAPKPKHPGVPGFTLPVGMSVQLLERLYTGTSVNALPLAGRVMRFDPIKDVCRQWLRLSIASIPHGKTWRDGVWPKMTDAIKRGPNGSDGVDYVFEGVRTIHVDQHGRLVK